MGYHSTPQLYAFVVGLIEGIAAHYGERVGLRHLHCMHRGDTGCRLEMSFDPAVMRE